MRTWSVISLYAACFLLLACNKNEPVQQEEKINFTKASAQLIDSVGNKLYGTWQMQETSVTPFLPATGEIGIYKDTTLYNLATLEITRIGNRSNRTDLPDDDVTGTLKFKTKSYPVGFTMHATGNRIQYKTGPQVFGLLEYRFPVGSHTTEPEEHYLQNLTLMGDNYEMEVSRDGKTMQWKGLNRGIKSIRLVKK